MYSFVTGEAQPGDIAKLREVRLHLLFVKPVGYAAEIDNASIFSLNTTSGAKKKTEMRIYGPAFAWPSPVCALQQHRL